MTNDHADASATRRRAELRGRESVARWRLQTGAWGARAYAVLLSVPALGALLWSGPANGALFVASLTFAGVALALSFAVARGRRWAAGGVLAFYATDRLTTVALVGPGVLTQGLLIHVALVFCLVQGVWGAFSLAAVERDRPNVPRRVAEPTASGDVVPGRR